MGMNIMRMKGRAKMMRTIKVTGKGKIAVKPDMIRLYVNKEELCHEYEDTLRRSTEDTELLKDLFEKLGYKVSPRYDDDRIDIVQNIIFNDEEKLVKYVQSIQQSSPVDSYVVPEPWDMPGYTDKVIMAAGTFTQGSSIELSCDGPIRSPYIAYQQGSLTYEYGKIAVMNVVDKLLNKD